MEKNLRDLIKDVDIINMRGNLDILVNGITSDSRNVKKGNIFFAINGYVQKGIKYLPSAVEKGASAVFVEEEENINDLDIDIPVISVKNARKQLSKVANNFYDDPSKKMTVIGVTGTKGKSTTTFMIKNILETSGKKVALLGGIGGYIGDKKVLNTNRTTPESFEILSFMKEAVDEGCTHFVLECSSQSIITYRIEDVDLDVVAFTNFSEDHISKFEHKDLDDYFEAKLKIVERGKSIVINWMDENVRKVLEKISNKDFVDIGILDKGYNLRENHIPKLFVKEENIEYLPMSTKYILKDNDKKIETNIELIIPGKFNIYNSLMAAGVCKLLNVPYKDISLGLGRTKVLGRLEPVDNIKGLNILLDYAHTASSLQNVLETVKAFTSGKLICCWGVGGDRDKEKRPVMGEISAKLADYTILTSDQVRGEDPMQILRDIEVGVKKVENAKYEIIVDRREAIKRAIMMMEKEDTLLIPGFGSDTYQEIKGVKYPFDERIVISEIMAEIENEKNV